MIYVYFIYNIYCLDNRLFYYFAFRNFLTTILTDLKISYIIESIETKMHATKQPYKTKAGVWICDLRDKGKFSVMLR